MTSVALWKRLRGAIYANRVQLRFALRMTVSGLAALTIARTLNLPLHGLWVVITAVVVTQMSVGGSLRATIEYIVGTFGGALYAAIIGLLVPHPSVLAQNGVLALTIAPLAFAAAFNPNFRVAPFSAVLVLLLAGQLGEGPIESAVTRLAEVALGGAVAVVVSLLVFPQRAHKLGAEAAARALERMARAMPELLQGVSRQLHDGAIARIQNHIGSSVADFQEVAAEAGRERLVALVSAPDTAPLSRTLLRLRHDLVIIGRAVATPLPEAFAERLGPLLTHVGKDASDFMRTSAGALRRGGKAASLEACDASLRTYETEVAALRSEGLTRALSSSEVERLFALGFALEQQYRNFGDLARCVREYNGGQHARRRT
jgi:uncharacterized membrane protein YccC